MPISTMAFSIIFKPKIGKLVKNSGSNAQWIAQANDAVIPNASQLILKFMQMAKI